MPFSAFALEMGSWPCDMACTDGMQLRVLNAAVRYRILSADKSQVLKESPEAGADFVLKEGVAFPAIPIALKTMKKGEKASLILKPGCELFITELRIPVLWCSSSSPALAFVSQQDVSN